MDPVDVELEQNARLGRLQLGSLEKAVEEGRLSFDRAREIAEVANANRDFIWSYLGSWKLRVSPVAFPTLVSSLQMLLAKSEIPDDGRYGFECFLRQVELDDARSTGLCDLIYSLVQVARPQITVLLTYVAFTNLQYNKQQVAFSRWLASQIMRGPNLIQVQETALLLAWRNDSFDVPELRALFMGAHFHEIAEAILNAVGPETNKLRKLFTFLREHGSQPSYQAYSSLLEMTEAGQKGGISGDYYNDIGRFLHEAAMRNKETQESLATSTAETARTVEAANAGRQRAERRAEDLQRKLDILQSVAARRRWWWPW